MFIALALVALTSGCAKRTGEAAPALYESSGVGRPEKLDTSDGDLLLAYWMASQESARRTLGSFIGDESWSVSNQMPSVEVLKRQQQILAQVDAKPSDAEKEGCIEMWRADQTEALGHLRELFDDHTVEKPEGYSTREMLEVQMGYAVRIDAYYREKRLKNPR